MQACFFRRDAWQVVELIVVFPAHDPPPDPVKGRVRGVFIPSQPRERIHARFGICSGNIAVFSQDVILSYMLAVTL